MGLRKNTCSGLAGQRQRTPSRIASSIRGIQDAEQNLTFSRCMNELIQHIRHCPPSKHVRYTIPYSIPEHPQRVAGFKGLHRADVSFSGQPKSSRPKSRQTTAAKRTELPSRRVDFAADGDAGIMLVEGKPPFSGTPPGEPLLLLQEKTAALGCLRIRNQCFLIWRQPFERPFFSCSRCR